MGSDTCRVRGGRAREGRGGKKEEREGGHTSSVILLLRTTTLKGLLITVMAAREGDDDTGVWSLRCYKLAILSPPRFSSTLLSSLFLLHTYSPTPVRLCCTSKRLAGYRGVDQVGAEENEHTKRCCEDKMKLSPAPLLPTQNKIKRCKNQVKSNPSFFSLCSLSSSFFVYLEELNSLEVNVPFEGL